MTTISLPVWMLATAVGIPSICLTWLVCALIRKRRKARRSALAQDAAAPFPGQPLPSSQFQQSLLCLQIDAVFNGLVALVETERIKLKSLMQPMVSNVTDDPRALRIDQGEATEDRDSPDMQDVAIDQQIAQIAASGKNPAGIASQLGISLAEVDLAMKMQAARRSQSGRKLEAVA